MSDNKYTQTRIRPHDLEWLRNRAEKHHRTPPEEISALRDLVSLLEERGDYDILPHPNGATPVPVLTRKVTSHEPK